MMDIIAQQPYVKIEREVTSIEQIDREDERMIYLYEEKLVTKHREFAIENVLDISHREVGSDRGMLYIHTSSGVFSYIVKTSTTSFINAFKQHKETLS